MALRHNLEPGKVFDITLGHDLNDIRKRQEVKQYIRTMRPGLVLLAPPCRMYSQLQNLLKGLREEDSEVMDRYLKNRKEAHVHLPVRYRDMRVVLVN